MSYSIKEAYLTIQGEGVHTGRVAVFVRFSGCNLWSGKEADRANAVCTFCDTDFVGTDGPGGGKFSSANEVVQAIEAIWGSAPEGRMVVFTGGEPGLQLDVDLVIALKRCGFFVAIETNGTVPIPDSIDWVCVSPKADSQVVVTWGDELKLVYPQQGQEPHVFEKWDFKHFLLQPMDGKHTDANTRASIDYCLKNPTWRLSVQTHKHLGIS